MGAHTWYSSLNTVLQNIFYFKAVCNIMVIPIAYGSHYVGLAYATDDTVHCFSNVCGFKNWLRDYTKTTQEEERSKISDTND